MGYDYGMGYGYDSGSAYDADAEDFERYEEEPQMPSQRRGGQSLRNYAQRVDAENQDLKRRLKELEEANRDLLGNGPQSPGNAPQNGGPQPDGYQSIRSAGGLTQAEQQAYRVMQQSGAMTAPPMGSEAEQIARIRNAKSPDELTEYLRSQTGSTVTNYEGQGFGY
ncbi:hypothetical protein [Streptomyces sp. NPDC001601]|uniref:hypothetical protein n=1 Tax=Streptomyces sp. NPDC001601 TaxID=3364592 RepID=UPI0036A5A78E